MPPRLVTIASFGSTPEAQVAQSVLAFEEIQSYLESDATVSMLWHLANAVGGVKLQVAEDDVDRALEALAAAEQPLADDTSETDALTDDQHAGEEPSEETPIAAGDATATRAFRASVIGLFACPPLLHCYSTWLLLRLAFSDEPLSAAGRGRCILAMAVNLAVCLAVGLFLASAWRP